LLCDGGGETAKFGHDGKTEVLCGSEWRRTEVGICRCDNQRAAAAKRERGGEVVKMERLRGEEEDPVSLFKVTFLFLQIPIKYTLF
jgi:hypothetical protein